MPIGIPPTHHWQFTPIHRHLIKNHHRAHTLASEFHQATLARRGTDEQTVKKLLTTVYQENIKHEFEKELIQKAHLQGSPVKGVEQILHQELASNAFKSVVKKAFLAETQDIWRQGKPLYRATSWDYRLQGMYNSLEHFVQVIKTHPAISLLAMGGVTILGHAKPVIGALSGAAIMGASGGAVIYHESKSLKHKSMNAQKALHYQKSGENFTAFLLTLVGVKGIKKGLDSGIEKYKTPTQVTNPVLKHLQGLGKALNYKDQGKHKMTPKEFALFMMGLLDDSLLPFNWAAEKMGNNHKS